MKLNIAIPVLLLSSFSFNIFLFAQTISKEELIFLTSEWKGERFADGRPKIPDNLLERAKHIMIDDAWTVLKNEGYLNQFEGGWKTVNDTPMTGRAVDRDVYAQPAGCRKKHQSKRCQTRKKRQYQFVADRYTYQR